MSQYEIYGLKIDHKVLIEKLRVHPKYVDKVKQSMKELGLPIKWVSEISIMFESLCDDLKETFPNAGIKMCVMDNKCIIGIVTHCYRIINTKSLDDDIEQLENLIPYEWKKFKPIIKKVKELIGGDDIQKMKPIVYRIVDVYDRCCELIS
jgi:hypothetical protein